MARWTDLAHRQEHTTNQVVGGMREHRGLVAHIAEGFYEGTIDWQKNRANSVSSHFIVDRDGTTCQMVDTADEAWAEKAGNAHWLSVEFAGFTTGNRLHATHPGWERLTGQQIEAAARLLARAHEVYGVPLQVATSPSGRGLGHHSMGGTAWGHLDCPGGPIIAQKATIVDRAKQLVTPTPTPPAPHHMEDDMLITGDLPTGFGIDEHDGWLDADNAVAVPLPAVGSGDGQWGPAWLYLAAAGAATIRYGCYPSGVWGDTTVDITTAGGPIGLPGGTTLVLLARKRTGADDKADSAPARWHIQYDH